MAPLILRNAPMDDVTEKKNEISSVLKPIEQLCAAVERDCRTKAETQDPLERLAWGSAADTAARIRKAVSQVLALPTAEEQEASLAGMAAWCAKDAAARKPSLVSA